MRGRVLQLIFQEALSGQGRSSRSCEYSVQEAPCSFGTLRHPGSSPPSLATNQVHARGLWQSDTVSALFTGLRPVQPDLRLVGPKSSLWLAAVCSFGGLEESGERSFLGVRKAVDRVPGQADLVLTR